MRSTIIQYHKYPDETAYMYMIMTGCRSGAHFMNDFSIVNPSCCKVIATQFCMGHDDSAVVACGKFYSNMIPHNGVTLKPISHRIRITMKNVREGLKGPISRILPSKMIIIHIQQNNLFLVWIHSKVSYRYKILHVPQKHSCRVIWKIS